MTAMILAQNRSTLNQLGQLAMYIFDYYRFMIGIRSLHLTIIHSQMSTQCTGQILDHCKVLIIKLLQNATRGLVIPLYGKNPQQMPGVFMYVQLLSGLLQV